MPDLQELAALGIVAVVCGAYAWRRFSRRRATRGSAACSDCSSAGPPAKEAPIRFYRRRRDDDA